MARGAIASLPKFICFSASITRVLSRSGASPGKKRTQLRREYSRSRKDGPAADRLVDHVDRGEHGRIGDVGRARRDAACDDLIVSCGERARVFRREVV